MQKRKWLWIILVVAILGLAILGMAAYSGHKNDLGSQTKEGIRVDKGKDGKGRAFTETELTAANLAIEKGIRIEDPQNDWYKFPAGSVQGDGRPDNSDPYPLAWTDFRSVSVGADQKYIYFKFQFWGKFPEKGVAYNKDLIDSTGAKITSFKFVNKDGVSDSADIGVGPWYSDFSNRNLAAEVPTLGMGAMISPYGRDETMETLFKVQTSEGMVEGGPGFDYIICALPLSLFNLKLGDTVTFDSSTETGSSKYHHEAVDLLLGEPGSKFGSTIEYVLGSGKYKILQNVDYSGHS